MRTNERKNSLALQELIIAEEKIFKAICMLDSYNGNDLCDCLKGIRHELEECNEKLSKY